MKIGAVYPQTGLGGDPAALWDVAVAVEALGYDYLLTYEHVLGVEHKGRSKPLRGPYTEADPFHDPFVAFRLPRGADKADRTCDRDCLLAATPDGAAGAASGRCGARVGRQVASGAGRRLESCGVRGARHAVRKRGAMLDEQIELLRRLWREPLIDYKGKFHRIDRAALLPRPKTDIPIYLGGFSEPALQRAARLADGFIFASGMENSRRPGIARLLQLLGGKRSAGGSVRPGSAVADGRGETV